MPLLSARAKVESSVAPKDDPALKEQRAAGLLDFFFDGGVVRGSRHGARCVSESRSS